MGVVVDSAWYVVQNTSRYCWSVLQTLCVRLRVVNPHTYTLGSKSSVSQAQMAVRVVRVANVQHFGSRTCRIQDL